MENNQNELLLRIARLLMLRGSFVKSLGLLDGKMGFIIFFYHYSRYTGKKIYDDFAGELIDEIYNEIHAHYHGNLMNGLCGIAWGMEYIIQQRFVEADANDILDDIDKTILEWDVRKIRDYSLETGLMGVAHYVIARCSGKKPGGCTIPKDYIVDLIVTMGNAPQQDNNPIIDILTSILNDKYAAILDNQLLLTLLSKNKHQKMIDFTTNRSLGIINNGFTGIGLNILI